MATRTRRTREEKKARKRAGSGKRDAQHRTGGDWTTITLPEGVDIFQPEAKSYRLDIVPYEVGKGNEYANPGEWYYERTFWVHRGIGPNNKSYVCPSKTAGKSCPICDDRARLAKDPESDEDLIKALAPKERQLWLVLDHDAEDKGVQLWEFSHWNFGKLLDQLRQDAEEDEEYIADFDDPDGGASLKVSFNEEKGGGYTYLTAYSIVFKPRPNGLSEELLGHGICLDDLIKVEEYDKLKGIYLQTGEDVDEPEDDDDDDDPKPKGRTRKPKKDVALEDDDDDFDDDDPEEKPAGKPGRAAKPKAQPTAEEHELAEGDMVTHEEFGRCEIVRISGDGTSLTLEDDDGGKHKGIGADEVKKEKPKKPARSPKTTTSKRAKPEPEPEEDDDWDEDEDDEPEEKPTRRSSKAATPKASKSNKKKDADEEEWDDDDDWEED